MNTPGLFLAGAFVTLILLVALALLSYAAVLDGRYAAAQKRASDPAMRAPAETEPVVAATMVYIPSQGDVVAGADGTASPSGGLVLVPRRFG